MLKNEELLNEEVEIGGNTGFEEEVEIGGNTGFEEEVEIGYELGRNAGFEENESETKKGLNKDLAIGFGTGLGTGLTIGGTAWFVERKKNMDLLKGYERAVTIAIGIIDGKEVVTYENEAIEINEHDRMVDHNDLLHMLQEELQNNKFASKRYKKRWMNLVSDLMAIIDAQERIKERNAVKDLREEE